MTTITRDDPPDSLHAHLTRDHAELSALFDQVVSSFESGDREQAAEAFAEFERRLEHHLAFEDTHVLPAFAAHDPAEAAAIAAEHRRIRARLAELGVGVDLHLTNATAVAGLVDDLRDHAAREDRLLYRWADQAFERPARRTLVDRVRGWRRAA